MNRTLICELKEHTGQEVSLSGWLYNSRDSGKVQFIVLRDGTGLCQCVVEKGNVTEELFEQHQKEIELAKQYGIELAYQPFGQKNPVEANINGGEQEDE